VLILSWEYPPIVEGGLARHVRKLAEGLVATGVEVHVLARGGGRLAAEEDRHGVTVHRVREPEFPKDDLDAFVAWVDAMNDDMRTAGAALGERMSFDLVHSHDWLVAAAARSLATRFRCPWLVTVHATEHGRHQGWVDKHPQRHIHGVERRMVRQADRVITCSHYMRGHVAEVLGIDEARVTVVPNGVDPDDLQPVADLPRLRANHAASDERLVLLVGRLVYEKGFHLALDALPGVIERLGNVRFLVAGSGTAEADLKGRRASSGCCGTGRSWAGSTTPSCTRSTRSPTCASCRRSTSRSGWWRSRRWPRDVRASSPTPAGCARSSRAASGSGCASRRATPRPWSG
jgi:glycogen(starch) synthase